MIYDWQVIRKFIDHYKQNYANCGEYTCVELAYFMMRNEINRKDDINRIIQKWQSVLSDYYRYETGREPTEEFSLFNLLKEQGRPNSISDVAAKRKEMMDWISSVEINDEWTGSFSPIGYF